MRTAPRTLRAVAAVLLAAVSIPAAAPLAAEHKRPPPWVHMRVQPPAREPEAPLAAPREPVEITPLDAVPPATPAAAPTVVVPAVAAEEVAPVAEPGQAEPGQEVNVLRLAAFVLGGMAVSGGAYLLWMRRNRR